MNQPYSVLSHIYAIQDDTNIVLWKSMRFKMIQILGVISKTLVLHNQIQSFQTFKSRCPFFAPYSIMAAIETHRWFVDFKFLRHLDSGWKTQRRMFNDKLKHVESLNGFGMVLAQQSLKVLSFSKIHWSQLEVVTGMSLPTLTRETRFLICK